MAGEKAVTVSTSYRFGAGTIGGTTATVNPDAQTFFSKTIPANSTNFEIDVVVDVSTVVIAAIEASKDAAVTTNDSGDPDDELALKANQAIGWRTNDVAAFFLTVDVTKFFVTTGAEATTLSFGFGVDATPGA